MTLDDALRRFNAEHGASFASAGGFAHGEVGASLVIDGNGRRAVAKWDWPVGEGDLQDRRATLALIGRLRQRGAPLPDYLHCVRIAGGWLVMQEFLPGATGHEVGDGLVEDLIAHNALQAGAAPEGDGWQNYMRKSLTVGLTGYCEHASLRAYGPATCALLGRVRAAGDALSRVTLEEHDAVHGDFHHLNVLAQDGRLSGVVDCDGYRSGDRMFDLVTLAFCLSVAECSPAAEARLWAFIDDGCHPLAATAYVAHMALRQVDWSIRHRSDEDVRQWLERSERAIARVTP